MLSLLTRVMIFAIAAMSLDLDPRLRRPRQLRPRGLSRHRRLCGRHPVEPRHRRRCSVQVPAALVGLRRSSPLSPARSRCARKGVYFIMITLAFGQMLFFLATSLAAYGGDDGMTLAVAQPRRSARRVLKSDVGVLLRSCFALPGRRLLPLPRHRRLALRPRAARRARRTRCACRRSASRPSASSSPPTSISGMIAGLAGFLLANQAEFVSPAYMTWQRSGELIFMVVLGGLGIAPRRDPRRRRLPAARGVAPGPDRALEDDLRAAADPGRAVRARRHRRRAAGAAAMAEPLPATCAAS